MQVTCHASFDGIKKSVHPTVGIVHGIS